MVSFFIRFVHYLLHIGGNIYIICGHMLLLVTCRWISDSRDEYSKERLEAINDEFKLYRCHTILNCARACPKGLNPGKQIMNIKRLQV